MSKAELPQNIDMLALEKELIEKGYQYIVGIDEAGRGPLAGPVVAAAVVLPHGEILEGVNDSKKLTEKKREKLFDVIFNRAISVGVGICDNHEIDEHNILNATFIAMRRAVGNLKVTPSYLLIDGDKSRLFDDIPNKPIVKGDSLSMSIAAASIIAKVTRDRMMVEYAKEYPEYLFEKHKGYGTKVHTDAILTHGKCEIHRDSFLKKILEKKR